MGDSNFQLPEKVGWFQLMITTVRWKINGYPFFFLSLAETPPQPPAPTQPTAWRSLRHPLLGAPSVAHLCLPPFPKSGSRIFLAHNPAALTPKTPTSSILSTEIFHDGDPITSSTVYANLLSPKQIQSLRIHTRQLQGVGIVFSLENTSKGKIHMMYGEAISIFSRSNDMFIIQSFFF